MNGTFSQRVTPAGEVAVRITVGEEHIEGALTPDDADALAGRIAAAAALARDGADNIVAFTAPHIGRTQP